MNIKPSIFAAAFVVSVGSAQAESHSSDAQAEFVFNGVELSISTGFAQAATYASRFAGLAPDCDPACISGPAAASGVQTLAEPEVLEFLSQTVGENRGLLVDARLPKGREMGFIPGSVSLPAETVGPNSEFRDDILKALGARAFEDVFNFADAQSLVVYDSGPTQHDAEMLITNLLAAGYPPEKIRYYRGGMQVWAVLGLTIQE